MSSISTEKTRFSSLIGKKKMYKCPQFGTGMEAKGELEDSSQPQKTVFQCPKCKNIELLAKHFNNWFRLDYP